LARYGLKYMGLFQEYPELRDTWLVHLGVEEKAEVERKKVLERARTLLKSWGQI